MSQEKLERQLDNLDPAERRQALLVLCERVESGKIELPQPGTCVNLHCHTFFSYNAYGYSPSKFAWLARKTGLAVAGIVDFDVLDGLDEFLEAGKILGLKVIAGMETRVFVPEFSTRVMNSPGEPGISYHMGVGFPTANLEPDGAEFLQSLRETSAERNRLLVKRVNRYLSPVELDYDGDVIPLTPSGNATERHICLGYARKARGNFGCDKSLAKFWAEKLSCDIEDLDLPESVGLQTMIRLKTMKRGGPGYMQPDRGSFPEMARTNRFIIEAGAIPTHTWLNGVSEGEQAIEELLDVAINCDVAALNIIPDRNYAPGIEDNFLANLYHVVGLAEKLHLPIIVGTEMNSPGQKFVDAFETKELSALTPIFLKGAYIAYAHSVLQQKGGLGYIGDWSKRNFENIAAKNEFFEKLGKLLQPAKEDELNDIRDDIVPEEILNKVDN